MEIIHNLINGYLHRDARKERCEHEQVSDESVSDELKTV